MKSGSSLKGAPAAPLAIGIAFAGMGCLVLIGTLYAVFVPKGASIAQSKPTATRKPLVTATPILTATPIPTDTATPTPTDLPSATPTGTPILPTNLPATRVPPTAAPPTITPIPPTAAPLGYEIGLSLLRWKVDITTQGTALTIPFQFIVRNNNAWIFSYGYMGVTAHDDNGAPVAFRKSKINDTMDPGFALRVIDTIKIYQAGQFNLFVVVCTSQNDAICDTPAGEYHRLSDFIRVTITG